MGAWKGPPPPMVWWSSVASMPAPWLGIQTSPSVSVNEERLPRMMSCDTNVRPVLLSVKRMGSKLVAEVGAVLSSHVELGVAGQTRPSKPTRSVCTIPPSYMTLPVFQFTPIDGSPEPTPMPAAICAGVGLWFWYRGGSPVAAGAGTGRGGAWISSAAAL